MRTRTIVALLLVLCSTARADDGEAEVTIDALAATATDLVNHGNCQAAAVVARQALEIDPERYAASFPREMFATCASPRPVARVVTVARPPAVLPGPPPFRALRSELGVSVWTGTQDGPERVRAFNVRGSAGAAYSGTPRGLTVRLAAFLAFGAPYATVAGAEAELDTAALGRVQPGVAISAAETGNGPLLAVGARAQIDGSWFLAVDGMQRLEGQLDALLVGVGGRFH